MTGFPSELDLRDLLAEEGFVRRLARGLLFDEHRVDDVVQDAWVAALTRRPDARASARAWLGGVTRNLASTERRRTRRTERRERQVAVDEHVPSVDEVLALEERRRTVLDALRSLAEPYRTVVLLRYFEDEQPQAIARRLGVPAATVRTRLRRGLDLLRQHLDRRHGGRERRREWMLALLPIARPRAGAVITTTTTALVIGMKKWAMAVIALAFAGWLTVTLWPAAPAVPDGGGAAVAAVSAAIDEPAAPPVEPVRETVAADADAGSSTRPDWGAALSGLRGRLVTPAGEPVAGAAVTVGGVDGLTLFADGPDLSPERGELRIHRGEARSDAGGEFLVRGLWPGAGYSLRAGVGGDATLFRAIGRTPGPGEVVDLGDLVLAPKATLTGVVVDDDGEPVAGAEVWAADVPAVVVAAASLDRFAPGDGLFLAVPRLAAGGAGDPRAWAGTVRSYLGREMLRDIVDVEEQAELLVVDGADWVGDARDLLPVARTTSAEDGSFRLRGVEVGTCMLVARRPGLATATLPRVRTVAGEERDVGELRMREGEAVLGRVVDHRGGPVAGAEVRVATVGMFGFRGVAFAEPAVHTGPDGSFAVRGMPRGKVLVAARRAVGEPWVKLPPLDPAEPAVVALPAPLLVELELRLPQGVDPATVEFALAEGPLLGELTRVGVQGALATEGRIEHRGGALWTVGDLTPGTFTLQVAAPGCVREAVVLQVPAPARVSLELRRASRFDVAVVDREGAPVAGAKVWVQRSEPPAWALRVLPSDYGLPRWSALPSLAGYTGDDGRLTVRELPAGAATVAVQHPSAGQASAAVELPADRVELVLPGTGAVAGTLTRGGAAVDPAEWRVVAIPRDVAAAGAMPVADGHSDLAADGSFEIRGLSPGRYLLIARAATVVDSLSAFATLIQKQTFSLFLSDREGGQVEVTITADAVTRADFDADPAAAGGRGRVAGRVFVDGAPATGVEVRGSKGFFGETVLARVDRDGRFVVDGLEPGEPWLGFVEPRRNQRLWGKKVTVRAGAETPLDLRIRTGSLSATVLGPDGMPVPNVDVDCIANLEDGAVATLDLTTDGRGRIEAAGLVAGRYRLEVDEELLGGEAWTDVAPAAAAEAEVRCVARYTLHGRFDGSADARTIIMLEPAGGGGESLAGLGDGGAFSFPRLAAGDYDLEIHVAGVGRFHAVPPRVTVTGAGDELVLRRGERKQ